MWQLLASAAYAAEWLDTTAALVLEAKPEERGNFSATAIGCSDPPAGVEPVIRKDPGRHR